uniref:GH36 C-terminal domain-containing protein n=1 Tax=Clostridium sp. NkU-1 TaxID=1095009 RepID=UPI000B25618E
MQRVSGANKGIIYLKLRGLEEQTVYEVLELGIKLSGAAFMYAGLPMPVIKADNEARVFTLVAR